MSPTTLIAIYAVVAIAAFSQTVAGFGFSLVAVPLLGLLIDPKEAVALALLFLLLNSALLAWGGRSHIQWDAVRRLLLGALPGLPLGMVLLEVAPEKGLRLALAAAVFIAVAVIVSGFTVSGEGRKFELGAGFFTGLLTTSLNTNGPPTVLALQARGLEPHQFRPTSSAVLGLTSAVGAVLFAAGGLLTSDVQRSAVLATPALAVGWYAGTRVRGHIPASMFRRVVLGLLLTAAVATVAAAFR